VSLVPERRRLDAGCAGRNRPGAVVRPPSVPMDTNTLLIIVIVLILLGGGGFFYRGRR
jgi:LPXTG-motif cell wall-anchored protein